MALTLLDLVAAPMAALHELAAAFDRKAEEFAQTRAPGPHLPAGGGQPGGRHAPWARRGCPAGRRRPAGRGVRAARGADRRDRRRYRGRAPAGFGERVAAELATLTGRPVSAAPDRFDALSHMDPYAAIAAAGSRAALTIGDFGADGQDEAFGEAVRPRAAGRDLHDVDARSGQHGVERRAELSGPIADEEPEPGDLLADFHDEVAGLLGGPGAVRVRGHAQDVQVAVADLQRE
jgi:hypothetical protein